MDFAIPHLLAQDDVVVGGATVQLLSWLKGLTAIGCHAGVLVAAGARSRTPGRTPFELVESFDPARGLRKARWLYYRYPRLLRAAREFEPDVIIQHVAGSATGIMARAAKHLRKPFVVRISNDIWADERYKRVLRGHERALFRYGLRSADFVVCQNGYQKESLQSNWPDKRIEVIYNPFSIDDADRVPLRRFEDRSYVAWLGWFQRQKNLPALLQVARRLESVSFRVAGSPPGTADAALRATLNQLESLPNVEFLGRLRRAEIGAFLSRAWVLLNTSRYEGFSNTFLEAFAAGTPVVAPEAVDPDSLLTGNRIGRTCRGFEGLADEVESMLVDPVEFHEMSARCREYVEKNHEPRRCAADLVAFLSG